MHVPTTYKPGYDLDDELQVVEVVRVGCSKLDNKKEVLIKYDFYQNQYTYTNRALRNNLYL
jgi:hypothetical protein